MKTDFLIVGSGFYGSVLAERIANILNKNVLILEKRNHIGGNCYSEKDSKTGIEYHKYGSHIFHTSNKDVWDYVNNYTEFNNYRHHVIANYKDELYSLPFNMWTFNKLWGVKTPEEAKT